MKVNESIVERIRQINWFQNCGKSAFQGELPFPTDVVPDWGVAAALCTSAEWDLKTQEAANQLTSYLHNKGRNEYLQWNKIVREAKAILAEHVYPAIVTYQEQHQLPEGFYAAVRWDLLHAVMEDSYRSIKKRPSFFLHLLDVYEAGHFPCGWADGKLLIL